MKHIAYVAHTGQLSGPNHSLQRLLQVLDRSRFEPVVYFPNSGTASAAFARAGEECRVVPTAALERTFRRAPAYVRDLFQATQTLRRRLREDRIDLVHINTSVTPYAGLAAWSLGIPVIWHVRECVRPNVINDLYMRAMVLVANRLVAVSAAVRRHLESRVSGSAAKTEVIHNGIDVRRFGEAMSSPRTRAELGLPETGTLVVMPAFLLPHKGQELMLEAAAVLVHELGVDDVHVLIAGEEPPEEGGWFTRKLHDQRAALALERHVHFLGLRHDLPEVLTASDIVCLPSMCEDSFPNGVLEAMAVGRPVVATRTGGIPEMVDDGRTGLLVPRGAPRELAAALAALITDRARSEAMGKAGRQRLMDRFSARQHADSIQALYEHVLRETI